MLSDEKYLLVGINNKQREKEGDLTQSYDKTPYTNRKFENQRTTHTNATKNFDYTTIADRLRIKEIWLIGMTNTSISDLFYFASCATRRNVHVYRKCCAESECCFAESVCVVPKVLCPTKD